MPDFNLDFNTDRRPQEQRYRDADIACRCYDVQRPGQAAFNVVSILRPDIAQQLNGTEFDTFINSSKVDELFMFLRGYVDAENQLEE